MATATRDRESTLTDYEAEQVKKIATWKAAFPNPFGELFRRAAQPVADALERVIPDPLALASIEAAYRASDRAATTNDLKLQAGVREIAELHQQPLEVCDRLSRRVGMMAQGVATIEGAVTGAGGLFTTVLDIPLLFTLCLRTIIKIGRCYGYPLDQPSDKAWVLGAFTVALASTKMQRHERTARLREIEELLLEETQEQLVIEETASLLTQLEVFEAIPVFAAATGALLNLSVLHKTHLAARHLFQERWLRDHGKLDVVAPAEEDARQTSTHGWSGVFARAGYQVVHGVSFAVAFPICLIGGAVVRAE